MGSSSKSKSEDTLALRAGLVRNWPFGVLAGFTLAVSLIATIAMGALTGSYVLVLSTALSLFGLSGRQLRRAFNTGTKKSAKIDRGTLEVDTAAAGSLRWQDRVLVQRDEIHQAFLVPHQEEQRVLVQIERKGWFKPPIFLEVESEADGLSLLRALRLDAGSAAAEMRIVSASSSASSSMPASKVIPAVGSSILLIAMITYFFLGTNGPPRVDLLVALTNGGITLWLAFLLLQWFSPPTVRIGSDGISTSQWFGRRKDFVPFVALERLRIYEVLAGPMRHFGVLFTLRDGTTRRLMTGPNKHEAERLRHRIEQARAVSSTVADPSQHLDALIAAHGNRSASEWISHLKRVGGATIDHRTAAIPFDALLSVVEDAHASETHRAGAALAAIANPDDNEEAKRRVHVAAETTASPKLRVALMKIAEQEANDEELADALDDLATVRGMRKE